MEHGGRFEMVYAEFVYNDITERKNKANFSRNRLLIIIADGFDSVGVSF